ncbi:hypothetical protein D3C81_987400 [compost metagenome]
MCKCNPMIRTPFCGRPGCSWQPLPRLTATIEADKKTAMYKALLHAAEAKQASLREYKVTDNLHVQVLITKELTELEKEIAEIKQYLGITDGPRVLNPPPKKKCSHPPHKRFTYNHGYHTVCEDCGEEL